MNRAKYWTVTGLTMVAAFTGAAAYGATTGSSTTVGSMAPASHWQLQHYSDCVEMSAAAIIGSLTGSTPTETDITAVALATTAYSPTGGTPIGDVPVLFLAYGRVAAVEQGLTLAQLETFLKQGYRAQVYLEGHQLWDDAGIPNGNPHTGEADHAVVVDTIDPVSGLVHITDSATKADEVITVDQFVANWGPLGSWATLVK